MVVKDEGSDIVSRVTIVYGSAYEEGKQEFISELHSLSLNWNGPTIIGGDFNLVRNPGDKSIFF